MEVQLNSLNKVPFVSNAILKGKFQLLQARLAQVREQFYRADSLFQQAINYVTITLGKEHNLWREGMAYYGMFLLQTEQFKVAEQVLTKAEKRFPNNSTLLAKCYSYHGFLYQLRTQNSLAEQTYLKSKTIWEENGLIKHPYYGLLLNDFALLKIEKGDLKEGEQLLELSEKINEQVCFIPTKLAYNFDAKGNVQFSLGNYQEAEKLLLKAFKIYQEKKLDKEMAISLNTLGLVRRELDSLEKAESYFLRALNHLELIYGKKETRLRALILDGIADVKDLNGDLEIADSLYKEEKNILIQTIGKRSVDYPTYLNNYASFKVFQGKYQDALILYLEAITLDSQFLGIEHPNFLITLYNIANCYTKLNDSKQAKYYYEEANALQLKLMNNYFSDFDNKTRLEYRLKALGSFDQFYNYACFQNDTSFYSEIQNINLSTKNLALDYSIQARRLAKDTSSQEVKVIWQKWIETRKQLTKLYLKNNADKRITGLSIDSIEHQTNLLEKQLIRLLPQRFGQKKQVTFQDLKKQLPSNEACIDFFNFYCIDEYGYFPDSLFYFALITRPQWNQPRLVFLSDNKELRNFFDFNSHYTLNAQAGYQLYQLLWKPLEPYLKGVNTIHISPDGLLHQVSFGGLFTDNTAQNILFNRYQIYYYSNLRDLITNKQKKTINSSALIIGNPAFDVDSTSFIQWQREIQTEIFSKNQKDLIARTNQKIYFSDLSGTAVEVDKIKNRFTNNGFKVQSYQQQQALENTIKKCTGKYAPSILHLATHGYFFSQDDLVENTTETTLEKRLQNSDNPMLRSGLLFAGANYTFSGGQIPDDYDDGILTAQEITNLNLFNTNLAVLSACNTGRGEVTDGEGVFGLQRAFKMAGVDMLLISLWKIPDAATAELMDYFYQYLFEEKSPHKALRQAQQKMAKSYPPYYWAGFVLFG